MNREEYFEQLLEMFEKHIQATDLRSEHEIEEQIFAFIDNNRDVELKFDLPNNYNPHA